jgi:hypothetical protein
LAVTALAALSGCKFIDEIFGTGGGDNGGEAENRVTGVAVSPQPGYALRGGTKQFVAAVSKTGNPDQTVVWSVEDGQHEETTIDEAGLLTVPAEETAETLTVRAVSTAAPDQSDTVTVTLVEVPGGDASLKAKFGITSSGAQAVTDTFNALHWFIQADGLSQTDVKVALGDWVELSGLTVAAYGTGSNTGGFTQTDTSKLRLIVAGINSFQSGRGVKDDTGTATVNGESGGQYAETANDGTPHVVFQFLHPPGKRRMEEGYTNTNGYAGSEMRKYLVSVENDDASGAFLAGLTAAGVPQDVLWAPVRSIANKGSADDIHTVTDLLWLPTEREMFGANGSSVAAYETAENQARLEYYTTSQSHPGNSGTLYWLASPTASGNGTFCYFLPSGNVGSMPTNAGCGVAPALCVK